MLRVVDMRDRAWYWVDGGGDTTWFADWILDSIQIHKWKVVRGSWFTRGLAALTMRGSRLPVQKTRVRVRAPAQAQEVGC